MPPIKSSISERCAYIVTMILLLSKIMPTYSRWVLKGLVYIIITALSNRQPSFYTKCTKLNIRLFCDIRLVFNTKCIYFMRPYIL